MCSIDNLVSDNMGDEEDGKVSSDVDDSDDGGALLS
jgi:hypothetical protein